MVGSSDGIKCKITLRTIYRDGASSRIAMWLRENAHLGWHAKCYPTGRCDEKITRRLFRGEMARPAVFLFRGAHPRTRPKKSRRPLGPAVGSIGINYAI